MCPAKKLVIFLSQSFIYNLFTIKNIDKNTNVQINQIDTENIPQITNPFSIKLQIAEINSKYSIIGNKITLKRCRVKLSFTIIYNKISLTITNIYAFLYFEANKYPTIINIKSVNIFTMLSPI